MLRKQILVVIFIGLFISLSFFPIIDGSQHNDNQILIQIDQTIDKLLLEDKIIDDIHVKYWIHVMNGIVIKNDYILLQQNKENNNIIKFEKEWTDTKDLGLDITQMNLDTFKIDETLVAWMEKVLFPEKNDLLYFYSIDKNQHFPLLCWEVRYKDGYTILYNNNGEIIGSGIPAPNEGFSLSGYNDESYPDPWIDWRLNADSWFKNWCDTTTSISLPTVQVISSYVSNPDMNIFFEIAHSIGLPTRFQANGEGIFYTADQIQSDMQNRDPIRFAMLCSCEAMRETGPGTLSYEFRKGEIENTVTVGYIGMASCPGWSVSLPWQDYMFYAIDANYTIQEAFNLACAEYPIIADCVVFVGDTTLKIFEGEEDDDDDDDNRILPKVLILYPTENSIVNGSIKITGTASDLDGQIRNVYIKIDNDDWQEVSGTYSWEFLWDTTTVSDGLHKITAVAIDDNGLQSGCYYRNVYSINDFLETNIIAPEQALTNQEITFKSTTSGGILPYNYTWDFGDGTINYEQNPIYQYEKPGEYNVKLTVKDSIDNTVSDNKEILIIESDNIPPEIEIIKPEYGLYIGNNKLSSLPFILVIGDITIECQVTDNGGSGLEKVEFYIDNNLKESFTDSSNIYQWTWDTASFFKHKITIKAYDTAGNFDSKDITIFKFG